MGPHAPVTGDSNESTVRAVGTDGAYLFPCPPGENRLVVRRDEMRVVRLDNIRMSPQA